MRRNKELDQRIHNLEMIVAALLALNDKKEAEQLLKEFDSKSRIKQRLSLLEEKLYQL